MFRSISCLLLTLAACGQAIAADAGEPAVLGKVAGLYVRAGQHLLIDTALLQRKGAPRPAAGRMVAEVRFAQPLEDGRSSTFAQVDMSGITGLDTGDVVKVALTESRGGNSATAPMRRSDEVRTVEAKFHTEMAQAFGLQRGSSWAALGRTPSASSRVTDVLMRQ